MADTQDIRAHSHTQKLVPKFMWLHTFGFPSASSTCVGEVAAHERIVGHLPAWKTRLDVPPPVDSRGKELGPFSVVVQGRKAPSKKSKEATG